MSDPGAEAGGEAASAAAAEAAAARAPLDACFAPMALETPETSSDARRAVAPAADASWRAGFHRGYAPGGYARGGADLLRALASASAYVPAPATGGDLANLDARFEPHPGAPSSADGAPTGPSSSRETSRVTQPSATWTERFATDQTGDRRDHVVTTNSTYVESSGTHSSIQAWASALLASARGSRSRTKPNAARRRRAGDFVFENVRETTRRTETHAKRNLHTQPTYTNDDVCRMTRDAARRALRTPKVLAALARRAVADADSADAFVIENFENADEDKHGYEDGKRCCLLPPSVTDASVTEDAFRVSFAVGYQGDALRVAPEILERDPSAWTAAPFEPVGLVSKNGKHVCSFVIAPSGADANAALETVVEIRAQYEQMRLGTMEAGARAGDTASNKHDALPAFSMTTPFSRSETNTTSEQTLPEEVFAYDPETNGSFDAALARLVSVANAVTHTGPFLVYLTGPSAAAREDEKKARRLATYAAARVAELADEDATTRCDFDFVVIPSDRLGRRRCTPAFARERATSAFCVAARRERKSTFGEKAPSEDARGVFEIARSREPLVTVSRRFQKRLEDEPNYVASNESRFQNRDDDDCDVTSATLCAYAFVTTEEDRGELVVALTDETGETFSVETTYASSVSSNGREWLKRPNADATPSSDGVATTHANLADWLVSRTLAFTAARAAAAGDAYASSTSSTSSAPETTERASVKNTFFTNARAAKRARVFFGAQAPRELAADEAPVFCAVGAGVVVTEVVPANQESGDRAFANVLRSAFGERRLVNEKRRKDGVGSAKPTKHDGVLLGETRLGFLRAEDEDERFFSNNCSVASLRADGSVATHAGGRRARDGRVAAVATRVAPVADVAEKTEPARDSSRVAFAFASLARAARAVRGVDRGERTRVRDVAPPHVAACASLAATLRDLERIAAGRGE